MAPHTILLDEYVEDMNERPGPYREGHLAAIRAWRTELWQLVR